MKQDSFQTVSASQQTSIQVSRNRIYSCSRQHKTVNKAETLPRDHLYRWMFPRLRTADHQLSYNGQTFEHLIYGYAYGHAIFLYVG